MANIIADIAGEYDALRELLRIMPDDEPISVGDMVDRGPKSREVIRFFQRNGRAILGNHEHMMIDHLTMSGMYQHGIWLYNGGGKTLESFGFHIGDDIVNWLYTLPIALQLDDILVSHTFIPQDRYPDLNNLPHADVHQDIVWNRSEPYRRSDCRMQITGHNSHWGFREFSDDKGVFGICLDQSRHNKLTGINTLTMKKYEVEF